jgi:hypothetical protein
MVIEVQAEPAVADMAGLPLIGGPIAFVIPVIPVIPVI